MKKEIDLVKEGIYGQEGKDMKIETYRICWYESVLCRFEEGPPETDID